jgi:prophage regulatory protein
MTDKYLLPETGFVRLSSILKIIPVGKSTWWEGIKTGRFPKPVKLGTRITAWRVEDIRSLIEAYQTSSKKTSCNTQNG